ncbi:MAG: alpha-amylase family glycosyl hydrolase, partial [Cetobacterium sp.]
HWMKTGIKGWRLDVADELPSFFIESLKYKCKNIDSESIIIGEVWEDASNKVSYGQRREYFNGKQLDSAMNYPLRTYLLNFYNGSIDSETLCKYMNSLRENYPKENYFASFNLLGSHDVKRIKTSVKDIVKDFNLESQYLEPATTRVLKSLSLIQFTLPGVPVIYYGDEVGVEGGKDPDNRRTYPWGKEDQNLLNWYKKISFLRSSSKVLKKGEINFFSPHPDVFAYIRFFPNERDFIGVLTNRNPNKSKIFKINLKEFLGKFSNNIATDIYRWNDPLIVPIDSSTNFPIKIPPLKTLLFSSKSV